jgi:DNA adenine methylase
MSWVGGKKALRDMIVERFPANYERYIEVFGGAGWVLFHKQPNNDFEVYNDFNPNLTNLYRCVRNKPQELIDELTFTLNSRLDINYIKTLFKEKVQLGDVKQAAYFYQLIRESYASGCDSFGCQPHSMWNNFPLIWQACNRLQKVVIENKDFEKLIRQYDRETSFFYCDPPYYNTESYYDNVNFGRADHQRLADALCSMKGKFLLSYNDCSEIREIYNRKGICIEEVSRLNNIAQRYEGGKQYEELLIANYDTTELARQYLQLTLFSDFPEYENLLKGRRPIWN